MDLLLGDQRRFTASAASRDVSGANSKAAKIKDVNLVTSVSDIGTNNSLQCEIMLNLKKAMIERDQAEEAEDEEVAQKEAFTHRVRNRLRRLQPQLP